jgi:hypothetical protein
MTNHFFFVIVGIGIGSGRRLGIQVIVGHGMVGLVPYLGNFATNGLVHMVPNDQMLNKYLPLRDELCCADNSLCAITVHQFHVFASSSGNELCSGIA